MNESDKSQLIINGFFRIDSSSANKSSYDLKTDGIWNVKLIVSDKEASLNVLTIRFLVLPKLDETLTPDYLVNFLDLFWNLKEICVKHSTPFVKNEYQFIIDRFLNSCESNAYWSTFYLDLKSDISIKNNYINRI